MIRKRTILSEIVDRFAIATAFEKSTIHARASCYVEAFSTCLLVRSATKILRAIELCANEQGTARDKLYRVHRVVLLLVVCCGSLDLPFTALAIPNAVIAVDHGPNTPEQQAKHYVVLVSLDGFRFDYAQKYHAENILGMMQNGATAPHGMIPAYPSVTVPNHYTIVTGLYPEHHGIVGNQFYDPTRKEFYSSRIARTRTDGTWYGGIPIWSLAERQGMRSACLFWPGSEARIAGERPSYYLQSDPSFPDEKRVDQVVAWLRLPVQRRPHFIAVYFGEVDVAGHSSGPDSSVTAEAVHRADVLVGRLLGAARKLNLPVDVILVSDHGMIAGQGGWTNLDSFADLSGFVTVGAQLYAPSENAAERAFNQLKGKSDKFEVFRRKDAPSTLHYDSNARSGDPIVVATGPYYIRADASDSEQEQTTGIHGFDPHHMPQMLAVFCAQGPDIRAKTTVNSFEAVDIYPLIAAILRLRIGRIDGGLSTVGRLIRPHS
jgi:alkaline phosphatase D